MQPALKPDFPCGVVYACSDWMVLDKPAGFSVQELAEGQADFHPAHRLDKDTSGLWLIARNSEANQQLSTAFAQRTVKKAYLAITEKTPAKKQGCITGDMERSRRGQWILKQSRNNPAITRFKSVGLAEGRRLVACLPETGKTHQIRVSMKSLGSPIIGDPIYNAASASQYDRLYLHAYVLAFTWQEQYFCFQLAPASGSWFANPAFADALQGLTGFINDATDQH